MIGKQEVFIIIIIIIGKHPIKTARPKVQSSEKTLNSS